MLTARTVRAMRKIEKRLDRCPHCRGGLEIVCVKFGLRGVAMISSCPNCAMAFAEECPAAGASTLDQPEKISNDNRDHWTRAWP